MPPRTITFIVAIAAAITVLAPTHATAADGGDPHPGPRAHVLSHAGHGAAVVSALGDRLATAAATNKMSASRLRTLLQDDPTAWLGADGQLFYVEAAIAPTAAPTASADLTPGTPTAAYPASQTFALHSLPSSTHTIFLDFDGADVSNTWWNSSNNSTPMPSRWYSGFTLDSDPAFSATELAYIQTVWRIVAEKYAPFDVDVTTQDPGPDGYNRSSAADQTYGDHVIITDDAGAVDSACGGNCSGVALLSTFNDTWRTDSYLEPAWVFSSKTWGSPVLTAHTAAHEVGHTFGLSHDGDAANSNYSDGHDNWFPIMGSSARAVGQFSKGEYAGATNTEDDLAIIASNGAPYRPDDHANANGDPLPAGTLVDGVISTRSDQDLFVVDHPCTTNLTARATGIGAGASLDLSVTVLDASGRVLGYNDPASGQFTPPNSPATPTGMDAAVTVAAGNGRYYVQVDGVGKGDPNSGYSDYGSLGSYQLAVSACDGSIPAPTTPTTTSSTSSAHVPAAPGTGKARSGRAGGPATAIVRWRPPTSNGGAAITAYRVEALLLRASGRVARTKASGMISSGARALTMRLPKGRYRFRVVAFNAVGASPLSAPSRIVRAR